MSFTDKKLAALEAALAKATPGKWEAYPRHSQNSGDDDEESGLGWDIEGPPEPMLRGQFSKAADAKLIAAMSPENIGRLLARLKAAEAAILANPWPTDLLWCPACGCSQLGEPQHNPGCVYCNRKNQCPKCHANFRPHNPPLEFPQAHNQGTLALANPRCHH